ncbi:MAG: hypothetical protein ACP6IQ_02000 [Candidatus Njordarchaeia archaeon]
MSTFVIEQLIKEFNLEIHDESVLNNFGKFLNFLLQDFYMPNVYFNVWSWGNFYIGVFDKPPTLSYTRNVFNYESRDEWGFRRVYNLHIYRIIRTRWVVLYFMLLRQRPKSVFLLDLVESHFLFREAVKNFNDARANVIGKTIKNVPCCFFPRLKLSKSPVEAIIMEHFFKTLETIKCPYCNQKYFINQVKITNSSMREEKLNSITCNCPESIII